MLISNVGITLSLHYCAGKMVKSAIGFAHSELTCGMKKQAMNSCERESQTDAIQKKACCQNKYATFSIGDNYTHIKKAIVPCDDIKFVAAFVLAFVDHYVVWKEKKQINTAYSPPFIEQDKFILFEVFLI